MYRLNFFSVLFVYVFDNATVLCFRLYKARPRGMVFGPRCGAGDRMGCGVKFEQLSPGSDPSSVPVFFTKNGKEVSI